MIHESEETVWQRWEYPALSVFFALSLLKRRGLGQGTERTRDMIG